MSGRFTFTQRCLPSVENWRKIRNIRKLQQEVGMETLHRISKTDLARKTHQIIRNVQRGQMTIVESHGQPEAAIIDIVDYHLLRAVAAYSLDASASTSAAIPDEQVIDALMGEQERYDRVFGAYLAGIISLSRAAELLNLPVIDLRFRFARLELPLRLGAETEDELAREVAQAMKWAQKGS